MRRARTVDSDRRPSGTAAREIVEFALRAPSVHNTQPWRWRIGDGRLDLYADRDRQLSVADPLGRNLAISCGAALEYAVVGAAAAQWQSVVDLLPDPDDPDHLAVLRLSPGPVNRRALADASLLSARRTDRRRLIPWPVPHGLLEAVAGRASVGIASTVILAALPDRLGVELLVSRALATERADRLLVEEQSRWVAAGRPDGVPPENARPSDGDLRPGSPSRYDAPPLDDESQLVTAPLDGLLVILSEDDSPHGWIDAGRTLCRAWVAALDHDLSVVPLSQVIEVAETRAALRADVLDVDPWPQLLLRVGWQELARSPLPSTPRRGVEDVLMA
ncbi:MULTISPECIES: Acg family FMN-binding oxidoreductase [unclassified Nocardioides]|uniref:Acg family FMN-binding oxidoreductase n=1 Tax=unclassified Nocardioides TaxID=2615069 RepID=UPI00360759A3